MFRPRGVNPARGRNTRHGTVRRRQYATLDSIFMTTLMARFSRQVNRTGGDGHAGKE